MVAKRRRWRLGRGGVGMGDGGGGRLENLERVGEVEGGEGGDEKG